MIGLKGLPFDVLCEQCPPQTIFVRLVTGNSGISFIRRKLFRRKPRVRWETWCLARWRVGCRYVGRILCDSSQQTEEASVSRVLPLTLADWRTSYFRSVSTSSAHSKYFYPALQVCEFLLHAERVCRKLLLTSTHVDGIKINDNVMWKMFWVNLIATLWVTTNMQ